MSATGESELKTYYDEKSDIAQKDTNTVMQVHGAGLIFDQVALRELQVSARRTGPWKAITDEIVEALSDEVAPPRPIFCRLRKGGAGIL